MGGIGCTRTYIIYIYNIHMLVCDFECYGFFSCNSLKLNRIIDYIERYRMLPVEIDSSHIYGFYKDDQDNDITYDYFTHYSEYSIDTIYKQYNFCPIENQYYNYNTLQFNKLSPIIYKYFNPCPKTMNIRKSLVYKYNIQPSKCIGMYIRCTDKYGETKLGSFSEYENKIKDILHIDNSLQILLVTDSYYCEEYMKSKFTNIICTTENRVSKTQKGIHNESSRLENYNDMFVFTSLLLIISTCKYIVCSSGNCSLWIMLYRGHAHNVNQFSNDIWFGSVGGDVLGE